LLAPRGHVGHSASTRWWKRRADEVHERLRAIGWPDDGDQWVDVAVRVDAGHHVLLEPRS
jgi:hypothetical protein